MKIWNSETSPWVIFNLKASQMAIPVEHVQSMVVVPEISKVPNTPNHLRGVINLRGTIVPLIDLRLLLGMPSFPTEVEEFCALMDQREADHRRWLQELEDSVRENRAFTLATDPHKCAFGKWYDGYKPDSSALAYLLKRFDAPHKQIHGLAEKVFDLTKKGDISGAYKMIDDCRHKELVSMITLFDGAKRYFQTQGVEVLLVLEHKQQLLGIAVDSIDGVERLDEGSMAEAPLTLSGTDETKFVTLTGRRKGDGSTVLILNTEKIVGALGKADIEQAGQGKERREAYSEKGV